MLFAGIDTAFAKAEAAARALDPAHLAAPRGGGRKQLPTTVIGLLVHIAEPTPHHVGQATCAAQLARVSYSPCGKPPTTPQTAAPFFFKLPPRVLHRVNHLHGFDTNGCSPGSYWVRIGHTGVGSQRLNLSTNSTRRM
jgi:hypothetical protein